jgi:hypothetical protein
MKNTDYIVIPKNIVSEELQKNIIAQLPAAKHQPGQRFVRYEFRNINLIETKDHVTGVTDNPARAGGTGKAEEELITSLDKGILVSEYPPAVYGSRLKDGFNRLRDLKALGYKFWVFAVYEDEPDTRTRFQADSEDALRDGRLGHNKGLGKKPATDDDFVSEGAQRVEKGSLKSNHKDIVEWINSIEHNFSARKVSGIATSILNQHNRKGKIESYSRGEAEAFVERVAPGTALVNAKDKTRLYRLWQQVKQHYITTGEPMPIAGFSTGAVTHAMWDAEMKAIVEGFNEMLELDLKFAASLMSNKSDPYYINGFIDQKAEENKALNRESLISLN